MIKTNAIKDQAQAAAKSIRSLLTHDNQYTIKLEHSTVWLDDIHGSGYVAWAEDNTGWDSEYTQTIYPEARQIVSGIDRLPTDGELRAFLDACKELA